MSHLSFVLLSSLALPFFLIPIEKLLPYPYLFEELGKLALLLPLLYSKNKDKTYLSPILLGLLVAVSESIIFSLNLWILGNPFLIIKKFIILALLHISTILVMFLSGQKNRYLLILSLCFSILFHFFVNYYS